MHNHPMLRSIRYWWQRLTRGWDDSETWSLDHTFAHFALPRLRRFKEITIGCPAELTEEEWKDIIQEMIDAFDFFANRQFTIEPTEEEWARANEGMRLFAKWYNYLWW
jgi:hypothetical protein